MKKIALIALLAAITSTSSFGQDTPTTPPPAPAPAAQQQPALRMGLSVSPVFSWFDLDISEVYAKTDGSRFNIQYGLHIDKQLGGNPNYYMSTGIFVLNSGGTIQYGNLEDNDTTNTKTVRTSDFRFNYINIPLTIMLRTNDIGYMTYFARVGIDSGFNINASQDYSEVKDGQTIKVEKEDASDFVNLYRAALHIELGTEYNFSGNSRLMVSLEWNNGLNNIFNDDFKAAPIEGPSKDLIKVKGSSNAIMLRVGVYF